MAIGFIGAGKVGFSLGKYFAEHGIDVSGYFSRNPESAKEAAEFTGTACYESMEKLVRDSEAIFLTVPDDAIAGVWKQLKQMQITGKCICHCSGVLSSEIFSGRAEQGTCGCSVHPLLAVNDKFHSYRELSNALFTIEGDAGFRQKMKAMLERCGSTVLFMEPGDKARYHAAAVIASNLMLGLFETAAEELEGCGFSEEMAKKALAPLAQANLSHLTDRRIEDCLTGPVERGDTATVEKHLDKLENENRQIYQCLSKKALAIARRKNPDRDYRELERLLEGE